MLFYFKVIYSRKPTINMSTNMMREAKRRKNRGFVNGDINSVIASAFSDGWDCGMNSIDRRSIKLYF
jgi:hypothetical protein